MTTTTVQQTAPLGSTKRIDNWWVAPLLTAGGLILFFGYLTLRAFNATYVWADPYISPTVAPPLFTAVAGYPGSVPVDHAWLGAFPGWWPSFLPQSPAFFIPAAAIAFRFTCYYYRGAYYKSPVLSPPNCTVRGASKGGSYKGETALLIFQNLHRYTLYAALFLLVCLWYEGFAAFFKGGKFGVGVGTLVMCMNAALLTGYTFGCHSWRHLIGGKIDCFSCDAVSRGRHKMWKGSSWLNGKHQLFAWCSLVWVATTDLYIYLVSSGAIRDLNTWD
ncbi:MAG: hypothetical protein JNK82_20755 [Myxococcaceae bacterium]|nr:hypothetical protein [Myxococcaceae bacterium]